MTRRQRVDLPMPWPVVVQVGATAGMAPVFTDDFWEWLGVVAVTLGGWGALFVVLWLMTRDGAA